MNNPRPTENRQQIIKNSTRYFFATFIGQGVGLIRSIWIPILFTPAQLGVWNLMNVVVGYGSNIHLGMLHGMNKLIPVLRGQGRLAEAEDIKNSVFWANAFLSTVGFACIWSASYFLQPAYQMPLKVTAVVVLFSCFFYYAFSLLRADNRFKVLSVGVGGLSILSTFFVLTLAYFFPDRLIGALIGLAVAYFLVVLYWFWTGRYGYGFQVKINAVRVSFAAGAPLLILGVLDSLFLSIDRLVIVAKLDVTVLGYYALAIMASSLIGIVPGSIASVIYPKMLERFGKEGSAVALRSLMIGPGRAIAVVMTLIIGGAVLVLPLFVRVFVPKYLPSVPLFNILIPAAFFYTTASIPGSFIIAVNKQKMLILIQVVAICLAFLFDILAIKMGLGVVGIAWSTAAAYAVYGISYVAIAVYYVFDLRSDRVNFFIEVYGLFVAMVLGLIIARWLLPAGETLGSMVALTGLRLILFFVVLLPALWWSNYRGNLFAVVREVFHSFVNRKK